MNYAFTNGKLLDGNQDMQVQTGLCILVKDGLISDIVPDTADVTGYRRVDLHGHYILPGLINMHVHLTGSIEKGKAADLIVTAENPLEGSAGIAESGAGSRTRQCNRTSCD